MLCFYRNKSNFIGPAVTDIVLNLISTLSPLADVYIYMRSTYTIRVYNWKKILFNSSVKPNTFRPLVASCALHTIIIACSFLRQDTQKMISYGVCDWLIDFNLARTNQNIAVHCTLRMSSFCRVHRDEDVCGVLTEDEVAEKINGDECRIY